MLFSPVLPNQSHSFFHHSHSIHSHSLLLISHFFNSFLFFAKFEYHFIVVLITTSMLESKLLLILHQIVLLVTTSMPKFIHLWPPNIKQLHGLYLFDPSLKALICFRSTAATSHIQSTIFFQLFLNICRIWITSRIVLIATSNARIQNTPYSSPNSNIISYFPLKRQCPNFSPTLKTTNRTSTSSASQYHAAYVACTSFTLPVLYRTPCAFVATPYVL